MIFVGLIALWILLPAGVYWSLSGVSPSFVAIISVLFWLFAPLAVQAFIVHKVLFPPWYKPGTPPTRKYKNQNEADAANASANSHPSSPAAAVQNEISEAQELSFDKALSSDGSMIDYELDGGQLGPIVGAAIQYYEGKITDPLQDFNIPFKNIEITAREDWPQLEHWPRFGIGKGIPIGERLPEGKGRKRKNSDPPVTDKTKLLPAASQEAQPETFVLRGWYVRGREIGNCSPTTIVILIHGAGRDRRSFLRHIPIFYEKGYSTLLLDCREHGCSTIQGRGVSYGAREAFDVIHAAHYARETLGYTKVVACGTSQGGASCIVASVLGEELDHSTATARHPSASSLNQETQSREEELSPSISRTYRSSAAQRRGDTASDEEDNDLYLSTPADSNGSSGSVSREGTPAASPREVEPLQRHLAGFSDSFGGPGVVVGGLLSSSASRGIVVPPSSLSRPSYLIDAVIAENPFTSREACVGDVMNSIVGRMPRVLKPVLAPLRAVFVTGTVLLCRWRLGLFHPFGNPLLLPFQWSKASSSFEAKLSSCLASSGAKKAAVLRAAGSPSSAHLPLPPLSSPACPLSRVPIRDLSPLDLVDRIAPRPLLLMHGLEDNVIKPKHSQLLYAQARDPKKLW
jgi:hypothetical protein